MNLTTIKKILLFTVIVVISASCTKVSRSLGELTDNKYAEARSGSVWAVPPPQLEPVVQRKKTVYISFRNISDADIDLTDVLKRSAANQGWKIVTNPTRATYRLRASLRFWGEVAPESGGANKAAAMGLISGAAVGLGTAGALYSTGAGNIVSIGGGGIAGGLVAMGIANGSAPREWALITDFVLEEYSRKSVRYKMARHTSSATTSRTGTANSRMAIGGSTRAGNTSSGTMTKRSHYFPHGIRLSVWANQMNMKEKEALPLVETRMEKVVRQMLPQ